MNKILKVFNSLKADKKNKKNRDQKGKKDYLNAEVTPGKLFDYYNEALYRRDELSK